MNERFGYVDNEGWLQFRALRLAVDDIEREARSSGNPMADQLSVNALRQRQSRHETALRALAPRPDTPPVEEAERFDEAMTGAQRA